MSNILIIVKKEISDAVSNRSFLVAFVILSAFMLSAGVASGETYLQRSTFVKGFDARWVLFQNISPYIKVLGALVAVVLGFNVVNKELSEGNLKVLLSYPIYRDEIILGKLIGGLTVISLATALSVTIAFSVYLFKINIPFRLESISILLVFISLSILLLSGFIGIGVLLSLIFKDSKISLILSFIIMSIFNSELFLSLGNLITDLVYGYENKLLFSLAPWEAPFLNQQARALQVFISSLNPSWSYTELSWYIQHYPTDQIVDGVLLSSQTLPWNLVVNNLYNFSVILMVPILTFIMSYIIFTRKNIS